MMCPRVTPAGFRVELSGSRTEEVVVRYQTVAGSASSADFSAQSGVRTIETDDGNQVSLPDVPTTQDTLAEDPEKFTMRLTPVSLPDNVQLATTEATATISASDPLTANVRRQSPTVLEGSDAKFVVELTGGTGSTNVVINYEVVSDSTPSATEGDDYEPPSKKLTISARQSSGTISVRTIDDDVLDRGEKIKITLMGGSTAGTITANDSSEDTLIADGNTVTLTVADAIADEGEPAVFTATLSGKAAGAVTVTYSTTDGTATSPEDFESVSNESFTIPEGDTEAPFSISTEQDILAEDSETFTVRLVLSPAPDGVGLETLSATATITDDALTAGVVGPVDSE